MRESSTGMEIGRKNKTKGIGPFCLDPVHARVGGSVSATLARNYHSVNIHVTVNIPVIATEEGVDEGLAWCFDKAGTVLNEHLKDANRALDKMVKARSEKRA